uniref:Putative c2h2-type zn-finger protein n=1 Tax=Culex tarsalis TaxID=7177 RepID=A0A1Q3F627_CULTA
MSNEQGTFSGSDPDHAGTTCEPLLLLAPEDIKIEPPLDIPPEPRARSYVKPVRSFACDRGCGKSFFKIVDLTKHQSSVCTKAVCSVCGQLFKSHRWLRTHMASKHSDVKPYECRVTLGCPERFNKLQDQRKHETACGNGKATLERRCSVCDKSFRTTTARSIHEVKCGLTTTCQICGMKTESVKGMIFHMNTHKGLTPFACRKGGGCSESFSGPEARSSHEATCNVPADEALPCLNCGLTFDNHAHLLKHFKLCQFERTTIETGSDQAELVKQEPQPQPSDTLCQGCGQQFSSAGALSIHQMQCKLSTTCTICSKEFANHLGLTYHMNSHYGLLPFECRATAGCPLRFSTPQRRLRHEQKCGAEVGGSADRVETKGSAGGGLPPNFQCGTCNESFPTVPKRDTHQMYCGLTTTCAVCGATKGSVRTMAFHMNMHRGIKPYECREGTGCGFRFYGTGSRSQHEKVCKKNNKKLITPPVFAAEIPIACTEPETSPIPATAEKFVSVEIKQEVEVEPPDMEQTQNAPSLDVKRCPGCKRTFASEEFLAQHLKGCMASKVCSICGAKFNSREALKTHLNKHNGVNPFKCRVSPGCRARFYDSTRRYYHEATCELQVEPSGVTSSGNDESGEPKPIECASCGKRFDSPLLLSRHQVRCNISLVCLICGKAMASFPSLQYHMNRHRGLMPFKCSYCPAKYSTPGGRNAHERLCKANINGKPKSAFDTTCDRCGQDQGSFRHLRKHRNKCNVSKTCGKCGQVFHSHTTLQAHMNRHNGVKPYQCRESSQCGARYYGASQRSLHERRCAFKAKIKAGSAEIKCKACGKSFAKVVHFQSHEALCVGRELALDPKEEVLEGLPEDDASVPEIQEQPEEVTWGKTNCVSCGAEFVSADLMQKHMRSCGIKKTCNVCMKSVAVGFFNYHMNKHSGVKPYCCRVRDGCPAQFYGPWLRNRHERICSGPEKPPEERKCRRCGKELDRRTMLHVCEGLEVGEEQNEGDASKLPVFKWSYSKEVKPKEKFVEQSLTEKALSVEVRVEKEKVELGEEKKTVDEEGLLEVTSEQPVELTFSCEACGKEFDSSELRNKHTSSCDKALPYQCRLSADCPERFANAQYRRNHEVICGKSRRLGGKAAKVQLIACRNCGKVCNGRQLLRVHKELCGPEVELPAELRCTVCPEVSDSVDKLQEHLDEHNREKLLKCRASANCSESFKQARTRIDHELECTAAGQTICSQCYKLLPNPDSLEEHEESCQADEFICRLCDGTYSDLHFLRKHLLNHDNPGQHARWWEKPTPNPVMPNRERYGCEHCGQEFLTQEELQKHPPFCKMVFRCTQCPAAFSQLHSLRYHENMHSGVKPFQCRKEGCEKRFANPGHRRTHEELCGTSKEEEHLKKVEQGASAAAKVFPCPHCTATFKAVNELKYHVNEHKADKKYECRQSEDCKETFATRGFRLKHEAICGKLAAPKQPRKVELIACKDCGKVFSNLQYLRIHKQKCAGNDGGPPTNLKCTLCKVISPDVDALQKHLDGHNREKPFQCRVSKACSEAYINERQRANHEFVCNADGQVICQRCFKLCPCLETLKTHEKICRGTEFPCRLCEVVLRSRNSQLVHYLRHDNKNKFRKQIHACPSCDKQFVKRINFLLHLKEHNIDPSDLELKCEICAATFKTSKTMAVHMNCHKGIKSYKCRYQGCEEAFFLKSAREVHEQNCTKLSLTCDICEVKLTCMRDYQLHIKSHDALNSLETL